MNILNEQQKAAFERDGVLVVENAVSPTELAALRAEFDRWVEESLEHEASYGECLDGRARFDLEAGHSAEAPALRRVSAPCDISDAYLGVLCNSHMSLMVADLIGPDIKHHHNKINSKLPGAGTEVKWHQDFPFTPHSNTDIITALLMVDEVTFENGPLEVAPGSHEGPLMSLWHDGQFTGAISDDETAAMKERARKCTGPAGSVCLMHTCLAHGSAPNLSSLPRTLFIAVYSAADAHPLTKNPVPNRHEGLLIHGEDEGQIRSVPFTLPVPQYPKGASFFTQQKNT